MQKAVSRIVPGVAIVLCYALLLNQAAYAVPYVVSQTTQPQTQQSSSQPAPGSSAGIPDQSSPTGVSVTPPPSTGPVPAQILAAHNIFLANAGAAPNFPVDANKVYNDIYAELHAWGYYQLAGSPQQADLIFELREVSPLTDVSGDRNGVYPIHTPAFVVTIRDPKTTAVLWKITSPVYLTGSHSTFDRWFSLSERNLLSRVKTLANQPLTAVETADLTTYPKSHGWLLGGIALGLVAAMAVTGIVIIHDKENNAKANQDAFCKANNIPMNECLGG